MCLQAESGRRPRPTLNRKWGQEQDQSWAAASRWGQVTTYLFDLSLRDETSKRLNPAGRTTPSPADSMRSTARSSEDRDIALHVLDRHGG